MKRKLKVKNLIIIGIILLCFIILVSFINKDSKKSEVFNYKFDSRVEKLKEINTNGINKYGWLQVQGTNVDAVIVSPAFYGDFDFNYGWISGNSIGFNNRKVIVGHNVLNVSSSPMVNNELLTDFEDLMAFSYYDFAKDNLYISYTENGVDEIYAIYAIGFYDYGYDNGEGFNESKDIKDYIKKVKKNSIYKYDLDVNEKDTILTIKTCTRFFGVDEKQQFVIDVRKLRDNEKMIKYNIKKTSVYKELKLKDNYEKNKPL